MMDELCRSNSVDLVVVDSVAALVPRAELEGDIGNQQVGVGVVSVWMGGVTAERQKRSAKGGAGGGRRKPAGGRGCLWHV